MPASTTQPVLGTVAGPGDDPNEFVLIAPADNPVKTGEFLTYDVTVNNTDKTVFARVTNRELTQGLPDGFLANPEISPDKVATTLGFSGGDSELYRLTARVIGYYNTDMAGFDNPRQLPEPGTVLSIAPDSHLETVLPNVGASAVTTPITDIDGTAHLGWLLNRSERSANIHLPIREFASTHLSILAATGSGKSYTASVLVEELMQPQVKASLLVFDPHGEYSTLTEMDGHDAFSTETGYSPDVVLYDSEKLHVRLSELTHGDFLSILDNPQNRMEDRLAGGLRVLQNRQTNTWSVDDLLNAMRQKYGEDDSSVRGLEWRLRQSIQRNDLFHHTKNVPLDDIVAPGQCTVLQMENLNRRKQQLITTVLLRRLYQERVNAASPGTDSAVPHPVFSLFEEGHRFAPASGNAPSLDILRTITSEGRKFGFGIGIISQRPSKLDPDVLSQCGTQITMKIRNPQDQDAIRQSIESAGEDVLKELPGLTPGQAVVSGDAMNAPALIRVRPRKTSHGADSIDVINEWTTAYEADSRTPTDSEPATFGSDESTGVQTL